jgi:putative oxidoreductase
MQTATTPREYFVITTGTSSSSVTRPVAALSAPPHHALRQLGEVGLSAVRIVVSFLFACHGARILFGIFGGAGEHGPTAPVGSWHIWWAGVIELVGGGLILLGLSTRAAALLCSGAMAFAYFTVHQPQGPLPLQNHGELAALYCWIFLLIAILGPGRFALDTVLRKTRICTQAAEVTFLSARRDDGVDYNAG